MNGILNCGKRGLSPISYNGEEEISEWADAKKRIQIQAEGL